MARLQISPYGPRRPIPGEPERQAGKMPTGIEVREAQLGTIKAQRLFKMRCDCGRSWFDLELPTLAMCPACAKLGAVSL